MCNNPNTRLLMRLVVDILLLSAVFSVALVVLPQLLETSQRGFFCGDESLAYPFQQQTLLRRIHVTIIVIAAPTALVVIIEMLRVAYPAPKSQRSAKSGRVPKQPQQYEFVGVTIPTFISECYNLMGVYLFGLALVLIAITCTKHFTGRLTPYFMEVCQPLLTANVTACSDASHFGRFIENYTCSSLTVTSQLLTTMRHSFPSGHAATTSYAMTFAAIYMQIRLKTGWIKLWRCLLQFCAVIVALIVAMERVASYRHHWSDAIVGVIVGSLMAIFMTYSVSSLFKLAPIKIRKTRDDTASNIYGYYTVMPRPRYYY